MRHPRRTQIAQRVLMGPAFHGGFGESVYLIDRRRVRGYNVITMKARLVRIGNSRGLRLPKPLIEEAGFKDEVEITLRDGALIVTSAEHPRAGWGAAVKLLLERREAYVIAENTPTRFEEDEWEW